MERKRPDSPLEGDEARATSPLPRAPVRRIAVYYGLAALCQGAWAWRAAEVYLAGLHVDDNMRMAFYMSWGIFYVLYLVDQVVHAVLAFYLAVGSALLAVCSLAYAAARRGWPAKVLDAFSCAVLPVGWLVGLHALQQRRASVSARAQQSPRPA